MWAGFGMMQADIVLKMPNSQAVILGSRYWKKVLYIFRLFDVRSSMILSR